MDIDVSTLESVAQALKIIIGVSSFTVVLLVVLICLVEYADKRRK
jgi:hypothetical protein